MASKMNNLFALTKSPSSLTSKRVSINPIFHDYSNKFSPQNALQVPQNYSFTTALSVSGPPMNWVNGKFGCSSGSVSVRGFHAGGGFCLQAAAATMAVVDLEEDCVEELIISKLGISQVIVSALAQRGITSLFPIQKAVLEPAMQGSDMIGRARTGTGKTLAFGIPIMDKIISINRKKGRGRSPLALILAPTRELARQVDKEFYESAPVLDTLCVYGGAPISRQMSTLNRGTDIVVGTPGRIIDLLNRGSLNLSEIQFVVLDEADQMLNVGFAEDVETILENVTQKHQTMMFSATMPSWILKLTKKFLKKPVHVDLVGDSDQKLADGISLYSIACDMRSKPAVLGPLISEHAKGGKCIVFTQTKRDADRLAGAMQRTLRCEALHGDISQSQRERTLSDFRKGQFNVLVATDVAARGLDVPNVDLVIHYELPNNSEIFVHRSGRTGRAGKKGSAILMHSSKQHRDVKGIEHDAGCRFTELPTIKVDAGAAEMYSVMSRDVGRFGSNGEGTMRSRSSDFGGGRSGGYGNKRSFDSYGEGTMRSRSSDFGGGRSGGYGNKSSFDSYGEGTMRSRSSDFDGGHSGGYGNKSSKFGREGTSSSVRTGGTGGTGSGRSRGGFNGPSSGRSGKFGGGSRDTQGSKRLGGFRKFGGSGSSKNSNWSTNFAEEFGSGRSRRFGDSDYDRNNRSSHFDIFGDGNDSGEW